MEDTTPEKWLNTRHAAEMLDITQRALLFRVAKKLIQAHKVGTRLYFSVSELTRYQKSVPVVGWRKTHNPQEIRK